MRLATNQITCSTKTLQDKLKYNGVVLVDYTIEYPVFCSSCYKTCVTTVNEFYRNRALEFRRYCETELFDSAVAQYKDAILNSFPVRVFEALSVFVMTYMCGCIISLYNDRYEYTGGAHGNTLRESQTWDLSHCGVIDLATLATCQPDFKTYILSVVEQQIKKEPDLYFENYQELIAQTFSEQNFYARKKGIVIYFQQYDIAPYSSGIREFLLPYSNCVVNPKTLCGAS